ncbi:urea ABC transporter permease subunit UrtB [Marinibacterium profundimaris]|uniref:Branched-chain amino acid ABC transporter permease n=1 Tax=Marinibacterium profundimaris TaxID=1679460 RepID=A0A225NHV1_9RHOB|nr:urea ABC transporter permease subunit UrtB [Marinibacterium profundimaris]OWU69999.1 branched-chain amino acid ABC transporter permease [Marinibacterium profundimaris]
MPRSLFTALFLLCAAVFGTLTTAGSAGAQTLQDLLQENRSDIERPSRQTIGPVITEIARSGLPGVQQFFEAWSERELYQDEETGLFHLVETDDGETYRLLDLSTGEVVAEKNEDALDQLRPNAGVRGLIGSALVRFQLLDPDPARRLDALTAIQRSGNESHLEPLRGSIDEEPDPEIRARKIVLERLLTVAYDPDSATRVAAIGDLSTSISLETRGALNPLLATRPMLATEVPEGANVKGPLEPGTDELGITEAYEMMIEAGLVRPFPDAEARKAALIANAEGGEVAGVPISSLDTQEARDAAYVRLAAQADVPSWAPGETRETVVQEAEFVSVYLEPDPAVTEAAQAALASISTRVGANQLLDLSLDGLSLASIYFLAAIGLAITFGVMRVINMAHGEFIMMGAYTGYVLQQVIPNNTVSILVAIPTAFAVTFAAGVAMERLVIRHLYSRPLETLLATFGISIALQQIAKNIFGTQARPLTAPGWLDGAWVLNDVVGISYIRIAIFVLALIFLVLLLVILNRTRLGLEVRAVTQNPRMASSMGINPDRINMLTFGLGSGIAGIAGVAIGLYAQVTSEMGQAYIVQSFMTVVVGGVGNIWGTLLGATMIGFLQKGIEWFNPSNTLAAQTYMIVFIIIFIQFRPRGIIALKGRAAEA